MNPSSLLAAVAAWLLLCHSLAAQRQIRITQRRQIAEGTVRAVGPGRITLADAQGEAFSCRVGTDARQGLALTGAVIAFQSKVHVSGRIPVRELKPGMVVSLQAVLNSSGSPRDEVERLRWKPKLTPGVKRLEQVAGTRLYRYEITAAVVRLSGRTLTLRMPQNTWFRKRLLKFRLGRSAHVELEADDLSRVRPGDRVVQASLLFFDTGDWVVESIRIRLAPQDEDSPSGRTRAEDRYARYSDAPARPRDVRSAHFLLHTDISQRQAHILLDKLETMYGLLAKYFGRRPRQVIRCFVVRQLSQWPADAFPPEARFKIARGEGLTKLPHAISR